MGEGDLGKINSALKAAKVKEFVSEREMLTKLKQVREGADALSQGHRNFTLGSEHDCG